MDEEMATQEFEDTLTGSVTRRGRPKGFDSATALDAAMKLFWQKGFEATSVGDLLDATGLSRSSFYDAFGSKRDLLLAAVTHYCETNRDKLAGIAEDAVSAREAIHAMLMLIANGGGSNGCLLVNCITELAPHDEDVRTIANDQGDYVEGLLVTQIVDATGNRASAAIRAEAQALISLAYGATLMRKSGMSEAEARKLLKTGEAMLD